MSISEVLNQIDNDLENAIERLLELLRIESISTDPAYKEECNRAANWLVSDLKSIGFSADIRKTPGHPMVVAHSKGEGLHVMFYGHYDVQPVDPIALWETPPFEPSVEDTSDGKVIRGRGASDDKGQLMTFVEACRAWKTVKGYLPINVSVFFEGEEETGSPSLVPFMQANRAELKSDLALICDTGLYSSDTPAIVTMLRGMAQIELEIIGPDRDLHSGLYGGISINPIRVLNKIIAGLHDELGRITLPGFYEGVPEVSDEIRSQWQNLKFDHINFLSKVGLLEPAGEVDCTPLEMIWARPTCDVNGISGGYEGDGFKTVLPSKASAKISFRLVGQQSPEAILASFKTYVEELLPRDCTVNYIIEEGNPAAQMSIEHEAFDKARLALSEEWQRPAAFVGSGGSIPIAGFFKEILQMDSVLIGFSKDNDQIHSPNEKYDVSSFHRGIRTWARILDVLAKE